MNYIIRIRDAKTNDQGRRWIESIVEDKYPGKTWPPKTGTKLTHDRDLALRFHEREFAEQVAKESCFKCGCGQCETIAFVEKA